MVYRKKQLAGMPRCKYMLVALALAGLPGITLYGAETNTLDASGGNAANPPCADVVASQPAPVPQAILQTVQSLAHLRIYGFIRLDAAYDTTRVKDGDQLNYVLPLPQGKNDNQFNMTARYTRLGIELKGPDIGATQIGGKLETDFDSGSSANSPNIRLRLAYLDIARDDVGSFRAGQDWDTIITVSPREVDMGGLQYAGKLGYRRPQFRLVRDIKLAETTKLVAKLGASRTVGEDRDGGGQDDGSDAGFPTVQGNLCLETKLLTEKPIRISISGHYGMETLDATTNGTITATDVDDYKTYSIIVSLLVPITSRVSLQGTVWQGENLDAYKGGIGQGINTQLKTGIAGQGGWGQLLVDLTQQITWNIAYGLDAPDEADLNTNDRSRNEIFFTSLFLTVKPMTFAIEYSTMTTDYKDADSATDHRFQGAVCYTF